MSGVTPGYQSAFHIAWAEGQKVTVTIPDGCRLVVFSYGKSPSAVPGDVMPSGRYELYPETLPGGSFPMGFQAVDLKYVDLVERIPAANSDEIFRAAIIARARGEA